MSIKQQLINETFKLVAILENSWDFIFSRFWLTVKTYWVLYMINTWLNTSKDLLNWTYWSKPNMTKKLKYLEANWFINRNIDKNDKRVFRFSLTQKALDTIKKLWLVYEDNINIIFKWIQDINIKNSLDCIKNILQNLSSICDKIKV